ncbi:MAG: hypothetical protein M3Q43_00070, partial [Actinomycetota bacterium]|nr:hypothetical protein [Actinomycetota bacterium]
MPTRCRRLSADAGLEVFGRGSGRVAAHQLQPEAGDPLVVALELDVALEHRPAQLAVLLTGLDLERRVGGALEVARLLGLGERPGQHVPSLGHVPERHQVRSAVRPDRRAGH